MDCPVVHPTVLWWVLKVNKAIFHSFSGHEESFGALPKILDKLNNLGNAKKVLEFILGGTCCSNKGL